MSGSFSRTALLIGQDGISRLNQCRVAVFGLGGVGSFAVEGLARCGVGTLYLIDGDVVEESNINRQVHALTTTVGRAKAQVLAERVMQINPRAKVFPVCENYRPGIDTCFWPSGIDYLVDAVDDVKAKVDLIVRAKSEGTPVISSMGMANRLDPLKLDLADISRTNCCPLARIVRKKLKEKGIYSGVKVVYSREKPLLPVNGHSFPAPLGSVSFVPPVAGFIICGEVIKDLLKLDSIK